MVFRIGERLRGRNDDRLARVDAQRVEVLHVADRDTVVIAVAHHLVLYLLPALQRLLNQHLRREREGFLGQFVEFLLVVAEAGTKSSQCVGGTKNDRIAQFGSCLASLFDVVAGLRLDCLDVDFV